MSGRETLPAGPEPEPALREVCAAMSGPHGRQQDSLRHGRSDVPERVPPAGISVSQGQSHPGGLQGTLQT
jgi:hypothetical protein